MTSMQEREQVAALNLLAGRARQSLNCVRLGAELSHRRCARCWQRIAGCASASSIFALELHRAECEFLTGALAEAEQRLAALSAHASR